MATATYYFDGHVSISDPDNNWTNDSNAFNGNTANYAEGANSGTSSTNELYGAGTTCPTTGGTITQVRIRVYRAAQGLSAGWTSYYTLSTPSGGFSWDLLSKLECLLYAENDGFGGHILRSVFYTEGQGESLLTQNLGSGSNISTYFGRFYAIELEVTYTTNTTNFFAAF